MLFPYILQNKAPKSSLQSNTFKTTCELFRILSQESQTNCLTIASRGSLSTSPMPCSAAVINNQAQSSQQQYELFAITKIRTSTISCSFVNDISQPLLTIVEPCQPSLKEIVNLAKKVLQFIKSP